jgi:hypothetical protein
MILLVSFSLSAGAVCLTSLRTHASVDNNNPPSPWGVETVSPCLWTVRTCILSCLQAGASAEGQREGC